MTVFTQSAVRASRRDASVRPAPVKALAHLTTCFPSFGSPTSAPPPPKSSRQSPEGIAIPTSRSSSPARGSACMKSSSARQAWRAAVHVTSAFRSTNGTPSPAHVVAAASKPRPSTEPTSVKARVPQLFWTLARIFASSPASLTRPLAHETFALSRHAGSPGRDSKQSSTLVMQPSRRFRRAVASLAPALVSVF